MRKALISLKTWVTFKRMLERERWLVELHREEEEAG